MGQTVEVPVDLYNKWLRAGEALDEWHDAFEDFLILHNPGLPRRLRKARRDQLSGNGCPTPRPEVPGPSAFSSSFSP